jgi:hypothetical protein
MPVPMRKSVTVRPLRPSFANAANSGASACT